MYEITKLQSLINICEEHYLFIHSLFLNGSVQIIINFVGTYSSREYLHKCLVSKVIAIARKLQVTSCKVTYFGTFFSLS